MWRHGSVWKQSMFDQRNASRGRQLTAEVHQLMKTHMESISEYVNSAVSMQEDVRPAEGTWPRGREGLGDIILMTMMKHECVW
jgi:hypothetical protein